MAHVDRHITAEPDGWIGVALSPKMEFDAREIALWLSNLLHRIRRDVR